MSNEQSTSTLSFGYDSQLALRSESEFYLPNNKSAEDELSAYLCGNSLGALSKRSHDLVQEELKVWASRIVEGHFDHPHSRPWATFTDHINPLLADIVGAKESEVACMGTLSANLHLMMNTFYHPTPTRYKILCEAKAFPSDQYAFASQAALHNFDPKDAIIALNPRKGEFTLRTEDILKTIDKQGDEIALVIFSGVQYYTGQLFHIETITAAAKEKGCLCGWDLAHAVGNVPLRLHDWGVDFAVWCSYKYLNAGPGAIAGIFLHETWEDRIKPGYAGWWGHDFASRFSMPPLFKAIKGAQGFQQSNPDILSCASLLGSLQTSKKAGTMADLRRRSEALTTGFANELLRSRHYIPVTEVVEKYGPVAAFDFELEHASSSSTSEGHADAGGSFDETPRFTIITPLVSEERGAQLSLLFLPPGKGVMQRVFDGLKSYGVIGDERKPDVIRLSPSPLYNTENDCDRAVLALNIVMNEII